MVWLLQRLVLAQEPRPPQSTAHPRQQGDGCRSEVARRASPFAVEPSRGHHAALRLDLFRMDTDIAI